MGLLINVSPNMQAEVIALKDLAFNWRDLKRRDNEDIISKVEPHRITRKQSAHKLKEDVWKQQNEILNHLKTIQGNQ
jgi:hypothetical protein